jgi:hypothetical protein
VWRGKKKVESGRYETVSPLQPNGSACDQAAENGQPPDARETGGGGGGGGGGGAGILIIET